MTASRAKEENRAILVMNRLEAEMLKALIVEAARRAGTDAHREGLLAIRRGLTAPAGDRIVLLGSATAAAAVFSILSRARPANESAAHLLGLAARPCAACRGAGTQTLFGGPRECHACQGTRTFHPPDQRELLAAVTGRNGLRSKRPADTRAYYVWRMARFHGGADVTLPMAASMDVRGDPFREELDLIAEAAAKRFFGTDLAGAHRWGRALGALDRDMPGLPASAYEHGPVADRDKPEEEDAELLSEDELTEKYGASLR